MQKNKPNPCPFCGAELLHKTYRTMPYFDTWEHPPELACPLSKTGLGDPFSICDLQSDIKVWNKRSAPPQPKPQAEQPEQEPVATAWEMFPAYLIDHCEGEIISEEGLQQAMADMLADPKYTAPPQPKPQPEQRQPLTEDAKKAIAESAINGHAGTRAAIVWAIGYAERQHGIKEQP